MSSNRKPHSNNQASKKRKAADFDLSYEREDKPEKTNKTKGNAKPVFNFKKKFKLSFDSKGEKDDKKKVKLTEADSSKKNPFNDKKHRFDEEKKLWEILRNKKTPPEQKKKTNDKLFDLIKGKIHQITFKHDVSRIVQTCFKYANDAQKKKILKEAKEHFLEMSKSHYGHHLVQKLLKGAPKEELPSLVALFKGSYRSLSRHKDASSIVELLYKDICSPTQKNEMFQEFYAVKYTIFKENKTVTLATLLESEPTKKEANLNFVQKSIDAFIAKGLLYHTFAQKLILEFLQNVPYEKGLGIISSITDAALTLIHTKDGLRVGLHCLGFGSPKDRKKLIKGLKGRIKALAMDPHGVIVLIKALDVTDDILITSLILTEIKPDLEEVLEDKNGRLLFLHLLAPRDKHYFTPETIELLQPSTYVNSEGETVATSKKSSLLRRSEQLKQIEEPLLKQIISKATQYLNSLFHAPLVLETLRSPLLSTELRATCFQEICKKITKPVDSGEEIKETKSKTDADGDVDVEAIDGADANANADVDAEAEAEKPEFSDENPLVTLVGHRFLKKIIQTKEDSAPEEDANVPKHARPDYQTLFFSTVSPFLKDAALHRYASFTIPPLLSHPSFKQKVSNQLKGLKGQLAKSAFPGSQRIAKQL